jgi:hypothetical protein
MSSLRRRQREDDDGRVVGPRSRGREREDPVGEGLGVRDGGHVRRPQPFAQRVEPGVQVLITALDQPVGVADQPAPRHEGDLVLGEGHVVQDADRRVTGGRHGVGARAVACPRWRHRQQGKVTGAAVAHQPGDGIELRVHDGGDLDVGVRLVGVVHRLVEA